MGEGDYFEPRFLLYDWQKLQAHLSDVHTDTIRQAEADIEAYIGYPDIQLDIAKTAVAQLAMTSVQLAEVVPISISKPKTVYVPVRTDLTTGKVIL